MYIHMIYFYTVYTHILTQYVHRVHNTILLINWSCQLQWSYPPQSYSQTDLLEHGETKVHLTGVQSYFVGTHIFPLIFEYCIGLYQHQWPLSSQGLQSQPELHGDSMWWPSPASWAPENNTEICQGGTFTWPLHRLGIPDLFTLRHFINHTMEQSYKDTT